jgi:hypothetical protein
MRSNNFNGGSKGKGFELKGSVRYALVILLFAVTTSRTDAAGLEPPQGATSPQLPDWSGLWESNINVRDSVHFVPPYTPEWKAKAAAAKALQQARFYCAEGVPSMMQIPDAINMFDILVTPKLTVMVFSNHEVRHIYTDGRQHPAKEDLWPTPEGDSVGRWENGTLVIDTISTRPQLMTVELVEFDPGNSIPASVKSTPTSEQLHIVERIRELKSGLLEDDMVIEDPVAFTHPWKGTYKFHRMKDLDRMIYEDCTENERDFIKDGKAIMIERKSGDEKK